MSVSQYLPYDQCLLMLLSFANANVLAARHIDICKYHHHWREEMPMYLVVFLTSKL